MPAEGPGAAARRRATWVTQLSPPTKEIFTERPTLDFMHSRSTPTAVEIRDNQIQRAVIVGQLAGGILHDFNNVLTVITGTIDILAKAVSDRPELVAITNLIDAAAIRGAKLTAHLLAFARGRPSEPSDIDVNALIQDASRLLRATLGVDIEIDLILAINLPRAWADPGQLMAAILSLAIVARDALPEGGKLTFRTEVVRGAANTAAAPDASLGDAVVIAVDGRGPRLAAEHRGGIFQDIGLIEHFVSDFGGRVEVGHAGDGVQAEIILPVG
jgi:signal transduction histidine kinase